MWANPTFWSIADVGGTRPGFAPKVHDFTMQDKNIVRTLRRARGLTQVQLATELGISRSHLSKVESGDDAPGRQLLEALAVFFQIPIDTFFHAASSGDGGGGFETVSREEERELLQRWRALSPKQQEAYMTLLRSTDPTAGG